MTSDTATDGADVPFETTEQGHYAVHSPVDSDTRPDAISVTHDDTTYTFSDFVTVGMSSKVRPDVLLYRECSTS